MDTDEEQLVSGKGILAGLEWTNALGVIFWYCNGCVGKLSHAVTFYDTYANRNLPTPPFAPTEAGLVPLIDCDMPVDDNSAVDNCDMPIFLPVTHTLYALVKAFFPDVDHVSADSVPVEDSVLAYSKACLRPRGYTRDHLDYRGSFISLLLLECTGMLSAADSPHQIAIVRQHMIAQLLSEGMWQWAVFVCMQIEDAVSRAYAVRDIVLRYGGKTSWEEDEDSCEYFLMTRFFVSDQLLHEATAYRCSYERNFRLQAAYLMQCGQVFDATHVVCRQLVPPALFNSAEAHAKIQILLTSLENCVDVTVFSVSEMSIWEQTGGSLLSYFQLKNDVEMLRHGKGQTDDDFDDTTNQQQDLTPADIVEQSRRIVREADHLLRILSSTSFGMCRSLVTADTVTKIAVHDIGTYLFQVITDISKTDYDLARRYLTQPELAEAPVLTSCRLQVSRLIAAMLGGQM